MSENPTYEELVVLVDKLREQTTMWQQLCESNKQECSDLIAKTQNEMTRILSLPAEEIEQYHQKERDSKDRYLKAIEDAKPHIEQAKRKNLSDLVQFVGSDEFYEAFTKYSGDDD